MSKIIAIILALMVTGCATTDISVTRQVEYSGMKKDSTGHYLCEYREGFTTIYISQQNFDDRTCADSITVK